MAMKKTSTLLAVALLCGAAHAQTTSPTRRSFGTGELPEFLKPYDLDQDGKLSVEERQAFEKVEREAKQHRPGAKNPLDTNNDGTVSEEEIQAARDAMQAKILAEREARFTELDTDANGSLDATELAKIPGIQPEQVTRMISHLDTNLDGVISKEEFLAALQRPQDPQPPPSPPEFGPAPGTPIPQPLLSFDADPKDGIFSETEFAAALAAVDTNQDGKLSLEEVQAYAEANRPMPVPQPLVSFDTNRNGVFDPAELPAVLAAVDTNHDGKLSFEEVQAYALAHPPTGPGPR